MNVWINICDKYIWIFNYIHHILSHTKRDPFPLKFSFFIAASSIQHDKNVKASRHWHLFLIVAEGAFKMSTEHWGDFSINFNINWIEIQYLGTCWIPAEGNKSLLEYSTLQPIAFNSISVMRYFCSHICAACKNVFSCVNM